MFAGLPDPQLREAPVETLQQDASLTDLLAGDVAALLAQTLIWQPRLGLVPNHELLPGVYDVDDGARPDLLQVLDIGSEEIMVWLFQ